MPKARLRSRTAAADTIRRRLSRRLGREGKGKYVAVDPESGAYAVADDLEALVGMLTGQRTVRQPTNFQIFRLGYSAAIEMRRYGWPGAEFVTGKSLSFRS
jgi:hypothetical protein